MFTRKAVTPRGRKWIDVSNAVKPRSAPHVRLVSVDRRRREGNEYLAAGE
jgi:hypothetical protein